MVVSEPVADVDEMCRKRVALYTNAMLPRWHVVTAEE
jgi:hypothetical protein